MGVKYAIGNVSVSAAYEHNNDQDSAPSDIDQYFVGVTGTFGSVTAKAVYGQAGSLGVTADQFAMSLTYSADALAVTAFYTAYPHEELDPFLADWIRTVVTEH